MKSTERHRLKENEVAHVLGAAREMFGPYMKLVGGLVVLVLVGGAGYAGYTAYRTQSGSQAQQMLADAMVALNARVVPANAPANEPGEAPAAAMLDAQGTFATEEAKLKAALPKLKAVVDAYPNQDAGIIARYHMAGALAATGQGADAMTAFDEVIKRAGSGSLYGRMARLGKADTAAKAGQLDAAIATWKELASSTDANDPLPKDAILMELARAYALRGNQDEARKTFTQLMTEHPESPYSVEAKAELDQLKS